MILRPIFPLLLPLSFLFIVLLNPSSAQKHNPSSKPPQWANERDQSKSTQATPNCSTAQGTSFQCPSDKSCIPLDWIGDGEHDCGDGADESEAAIAFAAAANAAKAGGGGGGKKGGTVDVDVGTSTTTSTQASPTTHSPGSESKESKTEVATTNTQLAEEGKSCPKEDMEKLDKCSEELEAWVEEIQRLNSSHISALFNQNGLARIEKGCSLLPKYSLCVDKLATGCSETSVQPNQSIRQWLSMQMYVCELLIPSIKEHPGCFGASRKAACPIGEMPSENSLMCSMVATTMLDIECVEKHHKEECNEVAIEMIAPMKSETEHVLGELNCSLPPPVTPAPSESEVVIASDKETEEGGESSAETSDAAVSGTTRALPPSSTPQRVRPETSTAVLPRPNKEAAADLTNALFAFGHVDSVCQQKQKSDDIYAPIRVKICAQKEELRKYGKCFAETARHEQTRCTPRLLRSTSCGAIDAFNKNVDCVIKALNELCPVEAQDVVVEIQEKLNDEAIAHKCYQTNSSSAVANAPINSDGFSLKPTNPRCNSNQENSALVCLVELVEINKQLSHFQSVNFLLEVSNPNSTLINGICALYEKYEQCLNSSVFVRGERCSFNSPLNTLARIGLSPVCGKSSRELLIKSRKCLLEVSQKAQSAQCQSGLHSLGQTVSFMLQGIHGEALLCKSFYLLRESFECGSKVIKEHCEEQVSEDLRGIKQQMNSIGLEEGCPAEEPSNLNEIISKPITPVQSLKPPPVARPIPTAVNSGSTTSPSNAPCEPEEQKKFGACVQPLTAFQPHPLAVIKQPKQIDEACQSFKNFNSCRQSIKCNPLWARGMSAMFDYACGDGYQKYNRVRQCIRRTTTRPDIRDCVLTFSKSAPQEACQSSNRLLTCAVPPITEKCGAEAVEFVEEYVRRFAAVIDPQCRIGQEPPIKPISAINCTANQEQVIQHCAAPLTDIHSRIDELFEGGLQAFLKNVNNLAPVFAEGCNLTNEFRECAKPILQQSGSCVVSSCLIRAGAGICHQPNVAAAIEENLGCVFKQVADPNFAKCLRSTISTLKQFNLEALRGVLPKFVECVEPIVVKSCGVVPLNVLKALSSSNICPVSFLPEQTPLTPIVPVQQQPRCTDELMASYKQCASSFGSKYTFSPVLLINQSVALNELCPDMERLSKCMENVAICDQPGNHKALRRLSSRLCTNKSAFEQRRECLSNMVASPKGVQCLQSSVVDESSPDFCSSLNESMSCMSEMIFKECLGPPETVSFIYEHTNEYLQGLPGSCQLAVPSVALQTGCSDQDLIQFLECEQIVDKFQFKPIAFISNASRWDEFCMVAKEKYRPCLESLPCRFEPITGASLTLFESLCEREVTHRDQLRFASCLADYIHTPQGKECLEPFGSVDLLTRDSGSKICPIVDQLLNCSAQAISSSCGDEALLHVYDTHNTWMHGFNSSCVLSPPNLSGLGSKKDGKAKDGKVEIEFSEDGAKEEKTANTASSSEVQQEASTLPFEPATEPTPEPEPNASTAGSGSYDSTPQPEPEPSGATAAATTPATTGAKGAKGNNGIRQSTSHPTTAALTILAVFAAFWL